MINIFNKQKITNTEIFEFWTTNTFGDDIKVYRDKTYLITQSNKELLISAKDGNVILNPERDFIQARIDLSTVNSKKEIIVEAKVFIERLYLGLAVGVFIFFLFNLKNSVFIACGFLAIFSVIGFYNYRKIDKAILKFMRELES